MQGNERRALRSLSEVVEFHRSAIKSFSRNSKVVSLLNMIPFRKFTIIRWRAVVFWCNRRLFKIMDEAICFAERVNSAPSMVWDENNDFSKIITVFLAQNLHRIYSIRILCRAGLAKDAVGLLRVMFENLADLKYMQQDKTKVQNFIDYDAYLRMRLGITIENSGLASIDMTKAKAKTQEHRSAYKKVESKFSYIDRKGKRKTYRRWSGADGLPTVAEKVNLKDTYQFLWGYFSNFMHSTAITADHYVLGKDGDSVVISVGTSDDLVQEVAKTATGLLVDIIDVINTENNMGLDAEIKKFSELLKKKNGDKG